MIGLTVSRWLRENVSGALASTSLSLGVALALVSACTVGGPTQAAFDNVTLRTSITVSGVNSPYVLALERGYFQDEGIILQVREALGSSLSAQLVAAGTDTFGVADAGTVMASREEGLPIRIVGQVIQRSQIAMISYADSGITEPKDLEGKSVALSPGSAATVAFPAFAAANDLDVAQINQVSLSIPAAITAMRERQVDANAGFQTSAAVPLLVEGLELNIMKFADWGANTLGSSIITTDSTIEQDPDLIRRFLRAAYKGLEDARSDPQAAVDAYVESFPQADPEVVMGQLQVDISNLFSDRTQGRDIGETDPADWQQTIDIMTQGGLLTQPGPIEEYYTDEFLP